VKSWHENRFKIYPSGRFAKVEIIGLKALANVIAQYFAVEAFF